MEFANLPPLVLAAFLTYFPAYVANMMPPLAGKARMPLGIPIALALLGGHKTWRGLLSGIVGGAIGGGLLLLLRVQPYGAFTAGQTIALGALMGFGALVGDAMKSAYKRWRKIPPGSVFFPWDQTDLVIGATLVALPFGFLTASVFLAAIFITPFLHFFVNVCAYWLGLKAVWW